MEPQRYLRCLGQPALFTASGEPIRFRTRKHLALLVYIAVEDRPHRRDRLAELLWPRVSAREARHSLATGLSILRAKVGVEALETSRDHVRLVPGSLRLDIERLQAKDVLGTELSGPLEVAAFLDGFEIADSTEFMHWKDRQQARLLPVIKDALLVLIDRCRRTGDTRQIEQLADRMLVIDELSEEAIRAKMEARAFAGDRLTALEIFEAWKRKLAEELQAQPSDLVEGMAVRLRRRGWERTTLTNIPNVPTDHWRNRRFVGRTDEYQSLYELWESARRGLPGHALVLGDSGVGKSTLVQRLITAAGLEGAAISRVQSYDLERDIPYSTLSGIVLGLLGNPGASATAPEALAELSRSIPEVRRQFPNIPKPPEGRGEATRIRLTEAFLELVSAIAEEQPVILVVDDLHLADDVSLAVLHLTTRRARGKAVMLILVARTGELNEAPQARRLRETAPQLSIKELDLLPLNDEESQELLSSLLEQDAVAASVVDQRAIVRAAAGYPMALEFLAQDWRENREQSLALGLGSMTADFTSATSVHLTYRTILERITKSLDSITRNVLNLAAILGPRLNELATYAVVDLSASQTMTALASLVSRRVLRDGPHGLEFVNELVRAAAYLAVPLALRRVLHGNIADHFRLRHADGTDLGLEIAWHCIRAGRADEAITYLIPGARNAIRSGAPYEAERALKTAMPKIAAEARAQSLIILSEALQEQGRWSESLTYLDEVESLSTTDIVGIVSILRTKARRRLALFDLSELRSLPTSLLTLMRSTPDPVTKIRAAVEAASVVETIRSNSVAPELLENLSEVQLESLELDDAAHLLLARAMLLYQMRRYRESLSCTYTGLALLERNNHPNSVLAMLQNGIGTILTRQGFYERSIPEYLKCYETATRIGNDGVYLQASANLALSLMRSGRYDEAIQWGEKTLEGCKSVMSSGFVFQGAQSVAFSYAMTNRNDSRVEEIIQETRAELANSAPPGVLQAWSLYTADVYAIMGRIPDAEREGRWATQGDNETLHVEFAAGPYARWVARTSVSEDPNRAYEKLAYLLERLKMYDTLDQADILSAKCWLDSVVTRSVIEELDWLAEQLHMLPEAVTHQLSRLGMLHYN